ncbi:PAS domain S-box protein [Haloarchaeobius baliensis]|uniref:PAS domain-containing protein n=1 Tax=Haloarchaeobius baliensis TaxID=1670458 RepID=UPI003F884897
MDDRGSGSVRVLHVDDDARLLELAATFLEREGGFEVTTTTDVDEALAILDADPVDCVVSDYDMPGTDGLAFLSAVRDRDGDIPFILFTGKGSEEIAGEAIAAGVTEYLQKESATEQYTVLANRIENAVSKHRAERAARDADERRKRMLERVTDAFFSLDRSLRVTYANHRAAEWMAHDGDAEGEQLVDLVPGAAAAFVERCRLALDERRAVTFEERVPGGDGNRWVEVRAYPDDQGLSVYFRDVTGRKERRRELERSERRFRGIFLEHSNPMLLIDPESGAIENANHASAAFYGYSRAELRSMNIDDINTLPPEEVARRREQADERDREQFRFEHTLADGTVRTVEVFSSPVPVGDDTLLFSIVHDVTDRNA